MARNDIERARKALRFIPPDLPRDKWHTVGRALISAGMTIDDIDEWSSNYIINLNNTSNEWTCNLINDINEWSSNYTD